MRSKKDFRWPLITTSLLAVPSLVWITPLQAQAPAGQATDKAVSISKVERKNRAPVSKEILRVTLPEPVEATLDNGVSVLILEDHRLPTVFVQLNIAGAGPLHEPAESRGLANVTAQMLREGTKTRSSKQVAEDIDKLGATINASAEFGSGSTVLTVMGLSDNVDQWVALLTDVLLNPTFPGDELAKLKQRLLVQLRQQRSRPGFLANERFARAVFGNHPAAVISAAPQSLEAITSEELGQVAPRALRPSECRPGRRRRRARRRVDPQAQHLAGRLEKDRSEGTMAAQCRSR